MLIKKALSISILCLATATACAITPQDPKYCTMLEDLKPNMQIGDVFLLMGPPHAFGQPPNLDPKAINNTSLVKQPVNSIPQDTPATRAEILKTMAKDPILGAFMKAPSNYENVLIWDFEGNSLNVAVKVKGTTVTDVKANFSCK